MLHYKKTNQQSFGQSIGILLIDCNAPFIVGDVGNALSYSYPVLYKPVKGLTFEQLYSHDTKMIEATIAAAKELEAEGVQVITADCGYLIQFQKELSKALTVPTFLSSLLQLPFMLQLIKKDEKVGVLCASEQALTKELLLMSGIKEEDLDRICIAGIDKKPHFYDAIVVENRYLDSEKMEQETVETALELTKKDPKIKALLLECSVLPPYGKAVQQATGLPVFDFITMIDYVHSSLVKKDYLKH